MSLTGRAPDEAFRAKWKAHADDFERLYWNLPPERREAVEELIDEAYDLIDEAAENR